MKKIANLTQKSRRKFVQTSTAAAGGVIISPLVRAFNPHVNVDNTIKIALIGCGGRGSGATNEALNTGDDVRLVAMVDAFQERLDSSYKNLVNIHGDKVAVKDEHKFVGLDEYKEAIGLSDIVFLATPPGFRPLHFEEAIKQGKHVFMEKPVATDAPGVRKIIEIINKLQSGIIGDVLSMRAYFNTGGVWVRKRKPEMTEMQYQVWNWYYFNWLSGDHIVEQHVHDLDLMNWLKGAHPVKAQGMGGQQARTGNEYGQIFDHHFVEYELVARTISQPKKALIINEANWRAIPIAYHLS